LQAARDDLLDLVKANLDCYRQQINDVDEDGFTALHYAARYNRVTVVEVLLNAGAGKSRERVPEWCLAIYTQYVKYLRSLLTYF